MKTKCRVLLALLCLAFCSSPAFSQVTIWDQSMAAGKKAYEQGRTTEA